MYLTQFGIKLTLKTEFWLPLIFKRYPFVGLYRLPTHRSGAELRTVYIKRHFCRKPPHNIIMSRRLSVEARMWLFQSVEEWFAQSEFVRLQHRCITEHAPGSKVSSALTDTAGVVCVCLAMDALNRESTLLLMDLYHTNECLWKVKSSYYKDRQKWDPAWSIFQRGRCRTGSRVADTLWTFGCIWASATECRSLMWATSRRFGLSSVNGTL